MIAQHAVVVHDDDGLGAWRNQLFRLLQVDAKCLIVNVAKDGLAAYGEGNFYGMPSPTITLEPSSAHYREEKRAIERAAQVLWM